MTDKAVTLTEPMKRMMAKYLTVDPKEDTFLFNHRLSPELEKNLWNRVKIELNRYSANFQSAMKQHVENGEAKIFSRNGVGTCYEHTFFLHGYECCLVWKNYEKKNQEAYYEAWNPHQGSYYRRNLLELEMKTA